MTQTISRMYSSRDQAAKAAAELKKRGYGYVYMFSALPEGAAADATPASAEAIRAETRKAYLLDSHARIYADRIVKGGTLVAVHAPFSGGGRARTVLAKYGPIDSGVPEPNHSGYVWNDATPFSSMLQLPLLTDTQLPFHAVTGLPSKVNTFFSNWGGLPLLKHNRMPFSSTFGLPALSSNPTPLSSKLGLPVLKRSR